MLSLEEYAVVPQGATLAEALAALDAAQERVPEGRYPHRALLVRDEAGRIVGKLGHFAFLRALVHRQEELFAGTLIDLAGIGEDLRDASMAHLDALGLDIPDACERAKRVRVGDVCVPCSAQIPADATLEEAVVRLVEHGTLSLLVHDGAETLGVLRLADLFTELAGRIRGGTREEEA